MHYRTWQYGVRKFVRVDRVELGFVICIEDTSGEAFLLIGGSNSARIGEKGYIEFKQGGPTGGFWEFHSESSTIPD